MKTNHKYVLIYVNYLVHLNFFSRFKVSLEKYGYKIIFITNKLSLLPKSYGKGIEIKLIRRSKTEGIKERINNSVEVIGEILTYDEGKKLYRATFAKAEDIIKEYNVRLIFIFGGTNIHDYALEDLGKLKGIPLLFFELSNIPGKIFVDPMGTNANSSLFQNIGLLVDYYSSETEYFKWRDNFLKYKERERMVPQGIRKGKINNFFLPLDTVGYFFLDIPFNKRENYLRKILTKFHYSKIRTIYDKLDLTKKYIFFPMQVSLDSQILINSKINNVEAIKIAIKYAQKENIDLLVKPHPAEDNEDSILQIGYLKEKNRFSIVDHNTFELIKNSELVITINSTVGLEAMVLGKKVMYLGLSFYKYLDEELLKNYIMSYLVNIDYFSNREIDLEKTKIVLDRITK